jgi:two-component system, cell cycle sensor histidine kinase and response regulator CckA
MSIAAGVRWTEQDSKTELQPFFENAPFAWAHCQRTGNVTECNPALRKRLGGTLEMAQSFRFADFIHPHDRARAERLLSELFERQGQSFQIESLTLGEEVRPVRWTVWRVPALDGNPDYAHVLADDVPREPEAAQRLRQAERLEAVGRLAGGVAHDFNNLLTGVLLYCDLLLANLEPCHRVRKYAEEIRKAGMQATGLVRQLLAVARPKTSEPRLFSLNEIADGMRNLLVRLIGENIELKFNLDSNLGLVKMDPTQSQQILLNLVLNARDAMLGGGTITVETSNCKVQALTEPRPGSSNGTLLPCALFVVSDTGFGMDSNTQAHLFEAFFTTKAGRGTGLGLATVYDIVSSNGGLIHVESAPGCGTRVSVILPLVPPSILATQDLHNFQPAESAGVLIPKG